MAGAQHDVLARMPGAHARALARTLRKNLCESVISAERLSLNLLIRSFPPIFLVESKAESAASTAALCATWNCSSESMRLLEHCRSIARVYVLNALALAAALFASAVAFTTVLGCGRSPAAYSAV